MAKSEFRKLAGVHRQLTRFDRHVATELAGAIDDEASTIRRIGAAISDMTVVRSPASTSGGQSIRFNNVAFAVYRSDRFVVAARLPFALGAQLDTANLSGEYRQFTRKLPKFAAITTGTYVPSGSFKEFPFLYLRGFNDQSQFEQVKRHIDGLLFKGARNASMFGGPTFRTESSDPNIAEARLTEVGALQTQLAIGDVSLSLTGAPRVTKESVVPQLT